jgi:hypothetical protein
MYGMWNKKGQAKSRISVHNSNYMTLAKTKFRPKMLRAVSLNH